MSLDSHSEVLTLASDWEFHWQRPQEAQWSRSLGCSQSPQPLAPRVDMYLCTHSPTNFFMFAVLTTLPLSPLPINREAHCIMHSMATALAHSVFLTFLLSLPSPIPPKLWVRKTCKLNFSKTVSDNAVGIRFGEALHKKLKTRYINMH